MLSRVSSRTVREKISATKCKHTSRTSRRKVFCKDDMTDMTRLYDCKMIIVRIIMARIENCTALENRKKELEKLV